MKTNIIIVLCIALMTIGGASAIDITLHSRYPTTANLSTDYTGPMHAYYIVNHSHPLNMSSAAGMYGVNYTIGAGDAHSYLMVPPNSISDEGVYRAHRRNETPYLTWEHNDTITEGNVWQWGGADHTDQWLTSESINSTHTWVNTSGLAPLMLPNSFYLSREALFASTKSAFEINRQQGIIIKTWDNEQMRGRDINYLINLYFDTAWESIVPTHNIEIWGLNSSFNPVTDNPTASPYGQKLIEWDGNRWTNHTFSLGNTSYAYPLVINATDFQSDMDEINYLYFKSGTLASKSYVLNATCQDPGICNLTYAQTETMWVYSQLGGVSTPIPYTPSFFNSFTRDDTDFLFQLYIADDQGGWGHSGVQSVPIGVAHYPVPEASFDYFNISCPVLGYTHDTVMGSTYDSGFIYVGVYCYADPDGGIVSHNITLHYVNGTVAGIVNNSLQTTVSGLHEIKFTTAPYYSTTDAYLLKCVSTDDEGSTATTWLNSFFTLAADGTQGYYANTYLMFWGMDDIPTLYSTIANDSRISYDAGDDVYTMHIPFFKSKYNDTFRFNETVHLESLNTEDAAYFRFGGETIFDNANIYGWNTTTDTAAPITDAYRGYVFSRCLTTGNITNSNFSYLGSDLYQQEGVNFAENTMDYLIYNTIFSHNSRGIIMEECENFNISHCVVSDNAETGIGLYYSDSITVENCSISDSGYDPLLYLYEACDNIIQHNTITNGQYGMRIRSNSNNNTLTGNDITGATILDYYFTTDAINNTIRDPASTTDKIRVMATSEVDIENTDNTAFTEDSLNSTYAYPTNFSMRVSGVTHTFDISQRSMTVTPSTTGVIITNLTWDNAVEFDATEISGVPNVWFNITHPTWTGETVKIYRDDVIYANETANTTGYIAYHYDGGWSMHHFEFATIVHPIELNEETPLLLFVVLIILLFGTLFYTYHAASYVSKIVTALISTWMSFMLSNMAVSGNVVLNYAELSSADVFIYGTHSVQIAALSHFFMFTGIVSALFMLAFAVKLVIDTYLDIQEKRKAEEEWDGVEQ